MKRLVIILLEMFCLIVLANCTLPDAPEKLPTVVTNQASNIDYTFATLSADLKDKGCYCSSLLQGFYISQDSLNIVNGQKIDITNGKTGGYGIVATGLQENTKYFVKSYAQNKVGLQLGNTISFVTKGYALPVVETIAVDSIKFNSVFALGNVISDGGTKLLKKGFCLSIKPNPTIADLVVNSQLVLGNYALVITNLVEGTKYYLKAFASNFKGVSYGKEIEFTTPDYLIPSVLTNAVLSITNNSANVSGEVLSDGYTNVFERGFVYSTNPNPSITDFKKIEGNGKGVFHSSLDNLIPGSKYYFKAYAINKKGIAYGDEKTFITTNVCNDLNNGLVAFFGFNGNPNDQGPSKSQGINFGATLTTDRYGTPNSAYQFSSNNCSTRIESKLNTTSVNGGLTISIWVLRSGEGCISPRLFEIFGDLGPDKAESAQWTWANNKDYNIGSVTSSKSVFGQFKPKAFNVWTHLVYSNDGKVGKIYQDGILLSQITSSGVVTIGGTLAIGRMNHPAWDAFNGKLDDFGIWNRALCEEEIKNLFNNPFNPN
jgi:hypothetical protein